MTLASASPQRRAILEQLGVAFDVRPAGVEEETRGEPRAVALANAERKALAVAGDLVLGADTIVALDGDILGKPADARQAREYLARLAGRRHEVVGGIALASGGAVVASDVVVTAVDFRAAGPE
ncbi:MAG: Maf family protein, partial [Nocardioidaceae bacterium]|nr:Maf family protein [Nocardioidaceae bacterium]